MIVQHSAPPELKRFAAQVLHCVTLYQRGELDLLEAVAMLRRQALRAGLSRQYGADEIEWIIGYAFEEVGIPYAEIRDAV